MSHNNKKPNNKEKRIKDTEISDICEGKMSNPLLLDPIQIGRKAWAHSVDQPIVHPINDKLIKALTDQLTTYIEEGKSQKFFTYLDTFIPDWLDRPDNAKILYRVATAHKYNDDFEKAEKFYLKAYSKFIESNDMDGVSDSLQELSICVVALRNDLELGWEYLEKATKAVPDPTNWGAFLNRVCFASSEQNDEHLKSALNEFLLTVPKWYEHNAIVHLFKTDAELEYLRGKADLWSKIESKIKGNRND